MKKFLWLLVGLLPVGAGAENLQFLSVIPSPTGVFSNLETAEKNAASEFKRVIFGNVNAGAGAGNGGTIELLGGKAPGFSAVTLNENTQLKSNTTILKSVGFTLQDTGKIIGNRLLAGTVSANPNASDKSVRLLTQKLYIPDLKTNVLRVPSTLNINNGASVFTTSSVNDSSTTTLCWTNRYQGTSRVYFKDFLLMSCQSGN